MRVEEVKIIRTKYYRPEIIFVGIDVSLSDSEAPSEPDGQPPVEPWAYGKDTPDSKYVFPDSPASDNPFGGSSPNYR